jgi:hypothetical protein
MELTELVKGQCVILRAEGNSHIFTIKGFRGEEVHVSADDGNTQVVSADALEPAPPRQCMWINPSQNPDKYGGYVPSLVVENEAGHSPMLGRGEGAAPWTWGDTLEQAEKVCADYNERTFGLTETDCLRIVASSMAASRI